MQRGRWIPVDKSACRYLPTNRAFTELEALMSVQLDYDNGAEVTVQGYSSLWRWSRGKVGRFLEKIGVSIQYPSNTSGKQNQRGQIMIQITDRSASNNEQIRIIDSNGLAYKTSRPADKNGQITDRSRSTTKNLEPKPKSICSNFDRFWQAYPKKQGKQQAQKAWQKINPDESLESVILEALEAQKLSEQWQKNNGQFIPMPSTWLNDRRWEDEESPPAANDVETNEEREERKRRVEELKLLEKKYGLEQH